MTRILIFGWILLVTFKVSGQNIFPGSAGFGTESRGAYAGDSLPEILYVDNLNDSGPGSLRDALSQEFPRIVLFNVSGTIHSNMALIVNDPYLFLAGQSAPGKGISVVGAPFIVRTHDVLIQDLRFRLGADYPRQSDCVSFGGRDSNVFNVVFDRCSFAFGLDENLGLLKVGPGITISNSIIGYGLHKLGHSCGMLVSGAEKVSLINNIFAFNHDRNPNVSGGSTNVEVINNLIYNSASHAVYLGTRAGRNRPLHMLLENNLYITGPDNMNRYLLSIHANAPDTLAVFWQGNLTLHEGRVLDYWGEQLFDKTENFRPVTKRPFNPSVSDMTPAVNLLGVLSESSGAKPQNRDAIDSLIIGNIKNVSGRIIQTDDELDINTELSHKRIHIQECLPQELHHKPHGSKFTNLEIFLNRMLNRFIQE
ncbi:pectate lyase [Marinilabilia rubra]|uniref:Pectate lyase n=1 Tax=Marinilabilia rubra TaxID=2162893 RepID=A0A2U2B7G0_9BACT|nr:pectate lyase [Marinilabilia rubra]PWD98986.1 pectate lyase [Marinilabilia rubra]